ncbi:MAG: radical SAM protein [Candidatus Eisenbacteria bacterium]
MKTLYLTNPAFGLSQTIARYFEPIRRSPKRIRGRKILNAIRAEMGRRMKKTEVSARPFILHFEPTNICNLKCPNCYTGSGKNPLPKGYLPFDFYKTVIDELKAHLVLVRLDGIGESFLHPRIFDMIRYATDANVVSAISTNFTALKREDLGRIIDAELDYLIISLDGATKETYEKLRFGAEFEEILANIREIVRLKRARKSRTPFIEAQFIAFEENVGEIQAVEQLARDLGVDRLLIKEARVEQLTDTRNSRSGVRPCYWLWYVPNISWTGHMKTCCTGGPSSLHSFGNVVGKSVLAEWNNERMQSIRGLFTKYDEEVWRSFEGYLCYQCYKLRW